MNRVGLAGWAVTLFAVALFVSFAWTASAEQGGAAVDLVGRNGKFQVIQRDGQVQDIPQSSLQLNEGGPSTTGKASEAPAPTDGESSAAEGPSAAGEGQAPSAEGAAPEGNTPPTNGAPPPGSEKVAAKGPQVLMPEAEKKEDTPAEKAARAKDVTMLRAMVKQGGAYFYTPEGKPLSNEDVDRLIEQGKIEDIRATGLHLNAYTPEVTGLKDKEAKKAASYSVPGVGTAPPAGSVPNPVVKGKPFRETVEDNKPFDAKAYSAGEPGDGPSPLAIPEERRPFRETIKDNKPFDPKQGVSEAP